MPQPPCSSPYCGTGCCFFPKMKHDGRPSLKGSVDNTGNISISGISFSESQVLDRNRIAKDIADIAIARGEIVKAGEYDIISVALAERLRRLAALGNSLV